MRHVNAVANDESDIPLPKHEIEMGAEEALGRPLGGSASERIATLEQRIKYLTESILKLDEQYASGAISQADYDLSVRRLETDRFNAELLLGDFRNQQKQSGN